MIARRISRACSLELGGELGSTEFLLRSVALRGSQAASLNTWEMLHVATTT